MWRCYVQAVVFVGLYYVGAVKPAHAQVTREEPRLTSNISCQSAAYWTEYQGVAQLNVRPPCHFDTGDIAFFGNSRLTWSITEGLFRITGINGSGVAWTTPQFVPWANLDFQEDGNLVIFDDTYAHKAVWSSNTWAGCKKAGDYKTLTFQQDGNLVIYCWNPQGGLVPMWSTNTWIRE